MTQIFRPSSNALTKLGLILPFLIVGGISWAAYILVRSPYQTDVDVPLNQPVPFSHKHHVNGVGLDCRYCHASVEIAASAGMPSTSTCMTCHSQIWAHAPMLQPVRDSYAENRPLQWTRVHRLPDYVYFNHSIHIQKGVGCSSCHGRVDLMPLTEKKEPMTMQWCLNCHGHPEQYLRPREEVFNMEWQAPQNQIELGRKLIKENHIETVRLKNCYTCHR